MKRFAYIQNTEIPGLRAHSVFVVKTTEAAARNGYVAHLLLPKRVVAEWNMDLSLWEHYQVKKDSLKIYYLEGFRFWLLSILRKTTGKYYYTLDTFMFAVQAWLVARHQQIDIVQTTDAHVVFVFRFLRFIYKPKIIFDVHHYPSQWLINLNAIDVIVCNAQGYKQDLIAKGVNEKRMLVLPNGYDPIMFSNHKIFHRKDYGLKKSDFVVGFIGRFETFGEEKGIRKLLQAVSQINPSIPVKVLLIGEPQLLALEYVRLARELNIENRVVIKPFVSPSDVVGIMKLFDLGWLVYPNTSRFRNHISPMKAMEYAAAHIPIIASRILSIQAIFDESQAFFVEDSAKQIAQSLVDIYHDPKRRLSVSNSAFGKIKDFSWKKRQKQILMRVQT